MITFRCNTLIILPVVFLLADFSAKGQAFERRLKKSGLLVLAWSEDTVHNYQFSLLRDLHFAYTITESGNLQQAKTYYGKCTRYLADTLFLTYDKHICPPGTTDYLVQEADGHYLIQKFTNGSKLKFLRLHQIGHRM